MKGTQERLYLDGQWIKFDKFGYEGLSEVIAYRFSKIIKSRLSFIKYKPILYRQQLGCICDDISKEGSSLISLLDLFPNALQKPSVDNIFLYYIPEIIKKTKLEDFGEWLTDLFLFDLLIQNEDRHVGNILMYQIEDKYMYAPVLDNANSLSFNTSQDEERRMIIAKPLMISHEEQFRVFSNRYSYRLKIIDNKIQISDLFKFYSEPQINRACSCLKRNVLLFFGEELAFY